MTAAAVGGEEVFRLFGAIEVGRQKFAADMAAMEKKVGDFAVNVKSAFTKAEGAIERNAGTIRGVGAALTGVGAAGLLVGKQLVSAAGQMERYQAQFEVLTGSAEAAKARLAELTTFAAKTPFDLPGIIEADRLVLAYNLDLGGLDKTLTTFGDTAAAMGVPMEQVIRNFAKLQAGMFDMAEMAPLGITRDKLEQFGVQFTKTGEVINRDELFPAAIRLIEKFAGTMDKVSQTTEGRLSNLSDSFFQLKATFGATIAPMVKEWVEKLTAAFESARKWAAANPELAATIVKVGLATTVFFTAVGPLLIALPSLAKGLSMVIGYVTKLGIGTVASRVGVAALALALFEIGATAVQASKNMDKMAIEIQRVEDKAQKARLETQRLPDALKLSWFQEWSQAASSLVGIEQEATKLRREYLFMMEAEADMVTERKTKKEQEAKADATNAEAAKKRTKELAAADREAAEERRKAYVDAATSILTNWQTLLTGMREGNRLTTSEYIMQLGQMLAMINTVNASREKAGAGSLFGQERLDILRQMEQAQLELVKEQEAAEGKLAEERKTWAQEELAQRQKLYDFERSMIDLTFQHKMDLQDITNSEDTAAKGQILQEELDALQRRRETEQLDAQSRLDSLERERELVKELAASETIEKREAQRSLEEIFQLTVKAQTDIRTEEQKLFEARKAEHEKTMSEITAQAEKLRTEVSQVSALVGDRIGTILNALERGLLGIVSRITLPTDQRPLAGAAARGTSNRTVIVNIDGRKVDTEPNVQAILDAAAAALEREHTHRRG